MGQEIKACGVLELFWQHERAGFCKRPYSLVYFNVLSLVSGTTLETLGLERVVLWRRCVTWGGLGGFKSPLQANPVFSLSPDCG